MGAGELFLRKLWRHVTGQPNKLSRLGLKTIPGAIPQNFGPDITEPGQPHIEEETIPGRIMNFLLCIVEARLWSYDWFQFSYPSAFAGLLSDNQEEREQTLKATKELWELSMATESGQNLVPGMFKLRQEVYWLSWPVNQLFFRLLAHTNFQLDEQILHLLRQFFTRLGDSKVIEDSNKIARRVEQRDQERRSTKINRILHHIRLPGQSPLDNRGDVKQVEVPTSAWSRPAKTIAWSKVSHPSTTALPHTWHVDNVLKGKKPFISKTPVGRRSSIAARMAMLKCASGKMPTKSANCNLTAALAPQSLVVHLPSGSIFLILTVANYCARAWPAERIIIKQQTDSHINSSSHSQNEVARFGLSLLSPWLWETITDIKEWQEVPAKWCLNTSSPEQHSYFILEQTGTPVPLVAAALARFKKHRLFGK